MVEGKDQTKSATMPQTKGIASELDGMFADLYPADKPGAEWKILPGISWQPTCI